MVSLVHLTLTTALAGAVSIPVTPFSRQHAGSPLASAWQSWRFDGKRSTHYRLIEDPDTARVVLAARSNASASALCHRVSIDPAEYPVLTWRWKIRRSVRGADLATKRGDDSPARLLIAFAVEREGWWDGLRRDLGSAFNDGPALSAALAYVWGSAANEGALLPNAHTDQAMMIVLQSERQAGVWVAERRNIYRDFQRAFGRPPPRIVGVAVMSDTDDTGTTAEAWFGDVVFRRAE